MKLHKLGTMERKASYAACDILKIITEFTDMTIMTDNFKTDIALVWPFIMVWMIHTILH